MQPDESCRHSVASCPSALDHFCGAVFQERCSWSGLANCRGRASCIELSMRMGVVIFDGSSAGSLSLMLYNSLVPEDYVLARAKCKMRGFSWKNDV